LDVTVNKIGEIWNKRIHFYTGNYEKYVSQKTQRMEQLEAAYRTQRERIEQLEVFINRFRYQATKAKQVQSRIKELEKMERIGIPEEERAIRFSFPQPKSSGRIVAQFTNVSKSYGTKEVFREVSFVIERGDRIALVGVNGGRKVDPHQAASSNRAAQWGRVPNRPQRADGLLRTRSIQRTESASKDSR
jgi:ATP-binding cassette subfamily F protein 3